MIQKVLAIETSCDDTSVAIVGDNGKVHSVVSANQDLVHKPFGGIVPEIASRNHTLQLLPLFEVAFEKAKMTWGDIDALVVTSRPGLLGSLLVGVVTAKTLSLVKGIPYLGINHLEAHLLAPFLRDDEYQPPPDFSFPYLALAVSGGHSQIYLVEDHGKYKVLGRTIDDAAGEAFDKFAKLVGLGFPGGPKVDKLSMQGNVKAFKFPRPLIRENNLNFSFSGLKTAALRQVESMSEQDIEKSKADLCASFQEAIVDCLLAKLDKASQEYGIDKIVITGGVSANNRLRARAEAWAKADGLQLVVPPLRYCTDNAAMVGYAGLLRLQKGEVSDQKLQPMAQSLSSDFLEGESR